MIPIIENPDLRLQNGGDDATSSSSEGEGPEERDIHLNYFYVVPMFLASILCLAQFGSADIHLPTDRIWQDDLTAAQKLLLKYGGNIGSILGFLASGLFVVNTKVNTVKSSLWVNAITSIVQALNKEFLTVIIVSRIAYGFTAGFLFAQIPKIIQETFPHEIYKRSMFFWLYIGFILYQLCSLTMIFNSRKKDFLTESKKWTWFNLTPTILTIPALFYFHVLHVNESLMSHVRLNEQHKAIEILRKIIYLRED